MESLLDAVPGISGSSLMRRAEIDELIRRLRGTLLTKSVMLEIGSYEGATAAIIAAACPDSIVISVDPFIDHDERDFRRRPGAERLAHWRANQRSNMHLWLGRLESFYSHCPQGFDLVLVDGAHEYESVLSDLRYGSLMLVPSGTLAVHDYQDWPEVHEATDFFLSESGFQIDKIVESMALLRAGK